MGWIRDNINHGFILGWVLPLRIYSNATTFKVSIHIHERDIITININIFSREENKRIRGDILILF